MAEMDRGHVFFEETGDALQVAVSRFVARSGVAAVETSIADVLEGHPLAEVWTRLLADRDICCVADLYGLEMTDVTSIRGIGPAAVGDLVSAIMARQPWRYRLSGDVIGVEPIESDACDEAGIEGESEPTLSDVLQDDALVEALERAGLETIEQVAGTTLEDLASLDGVGDDGALLIDERFEEWLGEGELSEDGPKDVLVGELAAERIRKDEEAMEAMAPGPSPSDGGDAAPGPEPVPEGEPAAGAEADQKPGPVAEAMPSLEPQRVAEEPAEEPAAEPVSQPRQPALEPQQEPEPEPEANPGALSTLLSGRVEFGELIAARLLKEQIVTADDLMGMTVSELAEFDGIGEASAREVFRALEEGGYAGYMTDPAPEPEPMPDPEPQPEPFPSPSFQEAPEPSPEPAPAFQPQPALDSYAAAPEPQPAFQPQSQPAYDPHQSLAPQRSEGAADWSPSPTYAPQGIPSQPWAATPQAPAQTVPMQPQADAGYAVPYPQERTVPQPKEQPGTWTPEGFVPDPQPDSQPYAPEMVADAGELATVDKGLLGGRKVILIAGIGVIAAGVALALGITLGGSLAHADEASAPEPVPIVCTVDDADAL